MGKQLKTSNIVDLKIKTIIYNTAHSLIIDLSNWFRILWLFLKFTWENFVNFFFSYFSQLFYCCCHNFSTKVILIISFLELFLVTSFLCNIHLKNDFNDVSMLGSFWCDVISCSSCMNVLFFALHLNWNFSTIFE